MSDPTDTARRVLDLDKQATQGPWVPWIVNDRDEGAALWIATSSCHNADEAQAKKDAVLIAEYRTAAPDLARALLESQTALAAAEEERDAAKDAEAAAIRTMDQALAEYATLPRMEADLATARAEAETLRRERDEARGQMAVERRQRERCEQEIAEAATLRESVRELVDGLRFAKDHLVDTHDCDETTTIDALLAKHAAPAPTLDFRPLGGRPDPVTQQQHAQAHNAARLKGGE